MTNIIVRCLNNGTYVCMCMHVNIENRLYNRPKTPFSHWHTHTHTVHGKAYCLLACSFVETSVLCRIHDPFEQRPICLG